MVTLNDKCPSCNKYLIADENTELKSNFLTCYYMHCTGCNYFEEYIVWNGNIENIKELKRIATNILENETTK